jgi:microcystin-dependent protein
VAAPFLGELKLVAFNFAPKGWAQCNGQFLPINQNQALFSLLGTTYGGNGQTTFALPELRGRVPLHPGQGFTQGQVGGQEAHTLTQSEMPQHLHFLSATSADANTPAPSNSILASANNAFAQLAAQSPLVALDPSSLSNFGGSQPHINQQPTLVLCWVIALQGIFPSRN